MTHNVLIRQGNLPDALDTGKNSRCLHQAAALALRQVNLRHISRNNRLRAIPDTGQKHFHLLRCRILRFIQNDKRIIQRASAHICQRGNLNQTLFHVFHEIFRAHDFIQRIIQGTQIGVYLLLQISGQKAQLFPRFNGRTGQDNAVHLVIFKGSNRHCHCQIGFPCTGRANAEHNRIILD